MDVSLSRNVVETNTNAALNLCIFTSRYIEGETMHFRDVVAIKYPDFFREWLANLVNDNVEVPPNLEQYCRDMLTTDGSVWGTDLEMVALAKGLRVNMTIHQIGGNLPLEQLTHIIDNSMLMVEGTLTFPQGRTATQFLF